jgi:hypothetical protein
MEEQTEAKAPFNPQSHLITLTRGRKENDYLEVKWRLMWFRDVNPKGEINTEMIEVNDTRAVFQARIYVDGHCIGCGHGSETPGDFNDYIEKAETKAIGRALAVAGYGTQFCTELDMETEDGSEKVVDTPVQKKMYEPMPQPRTIVSPTASSQYTSGKLVSDAQIRFMSALAGKANIDVDEFTSRNYPGKTKKMLTSQEASVIIQRLREVGETIELDSGQ